MSTYFHASTPKINPQHAHICFCERWTVKHLTIPIVPFRPHHYSLLSTTINHPSSWEPRSTLELLANTAWFSHHQLRLRLATVSCFPSFTRSKIVRNNSVGFTVLVLKKGYYFSVLIFDHLCTEAKCTQVFIVIVFILI